MLADKRHFCWSCLVGQSSPGLSKKNKKKRHGEQVLSFRLGIKPRRCLAGVFKHPMVLVSGAWMFTSGVIFPNSLSTWSNIHLSYSLFAMQQHRPLPAKIPRVSSRIIRLIKWSPVSPSSRFWVMSLCQNPDPSRTPALSWTQGTNACISHAPTCV